MTQEKYCVEVLIFSFAIVLSCLLPNRQVLADTSISYLPFDGPGVPYFQPASQGGSIYPDWYQATGEGGPFTASIDTSKKVTGTASLKLHLTSGIGLYAQFNPYSNNGRQFARNYMDIPSGWQFGIYNRMSFWFFHATNASSLFGAGTTNYYMGTYVKSVVINDTSSDESGGGHFYHPFNVEPGVWSYCIMNTHPGHQRGDPGSLDSGNRPYPTTPAYGGSGDPANTYTYYDTLTRWYISGEGGSGGFPQDYWLDDVKIYQEPVVENDNLVYGICSSYNQPTNRLTLTWNRYKGVDTSHEVRYAFSDIHTLGWNNATPAPNGTVDSTGNDYNGMVYTTTAINVGSNPTVYFAIKPQGETLFSQIALQLTTGIPDTTPPTSPTNLAATSPSQSSIAVTWSPATDNIGVTNYIVERCQGSGCSNFTQVGTPTSSPFVDSGLTASTVYNYHVRAIDAAGNLSGWSNVVGATTQAPDTQAPTAPTSLTATASSSSQINLTWTASTDNVAVTSYKVERCQGSSCTNFSEITNQPITNYQDTGLSASTTYRYQVRATDGGGNNSSYSNIISATTSTVPPISTIGETNIVSGNDSGSENLLVAQPAALTSAGTLQSISFYVRTAAGNLRLGVYDATGPSGGPGNLKASTNSFVAITGWNTQNVTAPVSLEPGTYWLVFFMDDGNLVSAMDSTGSIQYAYLTYGAFPAIFPASQNYTGHWSFYATLTNPSSSSSCNTVTTTNFSQAAYNSYGAPFDAFQTSTNLLDAKCTSSDTHTINLTTGITGDTTRIVYTKGYYYDPVTAGWTQYSGTCNGALNGEWCQGSISATITNPNISTASAANPTYLVGMTCSVQGGSWKCGCRDTTCSNFYWQVQGAGQ